MGIEQCRSVIDSMREENRQRELERERREEEARQLEQLRIAHELERLDDYARHLVKQEAATGYGDELSKHRNRYNLDD